MRLASGMRRGLLALVVGVVLAGAVDRASAQGFKKKKPAAASVKATPKKKPKKKTPAKRTRTVKKKPRPAPAEPRRPMP